MATPPTDVTPPEEPKDAFTEKHGFAKATFDDEFKKLNDERVAAGKNPIELANEDELQIKDANDEKKEALEALRKKLREEAESIELTAARKAQITASNKKGQEPESKAPPKVKAPGKPAAKQEFTDYAYSEDREWGMLAKVFGRIFDFFVKSFPMQFVYLGAMKVGATVTTEVRGAGNYTLGGMMSLMGMKSAPKYLQRGRYLSGTIPLMYDLGAYLLTAVTTRGEKRSAGLAAISQRMLNEENGSLRNHLVTKTANLTGPLTGDIVQNTIQRLGSATGKLFFDFAPIKALTELAGIVYQYKPDAEHPKGIVNKIFDFLYDPIGQGPLAIVVGSARKAPGVKYELEGHPDKDMDIPGWLNMWYGDYQTALKNPAVNVDHVYHKGNAPSTDVSNLNVTVDAAKGLGNLVLGTPIYLFRKLTGSNKGFPRIFETSRSKFADETAAQQADVNAASGGPGSVSARVAAANASATPASTPTVPTVPTSGTGTAPIPPMRPPVPPTSTSTSTSTPAKPPTPVHVEITHGGVADMPTRGSSKVAPSWRHGFGSRMLTTGAGLFKTAREEPHTVELEIGGGGGPAPTSSSHKV